jgi:hypothetical protein
MREGERLSSRPRSKNSRGQLDSNTFSLASKFNWLLFVITLGILVIIFWNELMSPPIFDGRSFFVAGQRIYQGEILIAYEPIEGSGPFTYSPFSLPIFHVVYLIQSFSQINTITLLNLFALAVIFNFAMSFNANVSRIKKGLILLGSTLAFLGPILESIKIQQIDLIIVAFGIWAIFYSKSKTSIATVFLVISFLKPQFLIVYFASVFITRKSLMKHFVTLGSIIIFEFLYFLKEKIDLRSLLDLFDKYLATSKTIASNIDVSNQSLWASVKRFLTSPEVFGRYYPTECASTPLRRESFLDFSRTHSESIIQNATSPRIGQVLFITFFVFVCLKILIPICRMNFANHTKKNMMYLIMTLPFISPVFWYVHLVYVYPVFIFLYLETKKRYLQLSLVVAAIFILVTNWRIIGNDLADRLLYLNLTIFACITILFVASHNLKQSNVIPRIQDQDIYSRLKNMANKLRRF